MNELTLMVTTEEGNKIINALALLPYKDSFELINKLQKQASKQIETETKNVETI